MGKMNRYKMYEYKMTCSHLKQTQFVLCQIQTARLRPINKTFSVLLYSYISTSRIGKTRNCVETRRPHGGVFSVNFEFFQSPRVLFTCISLRKQMFLIIFLL